MSHVVTRAVVLDNLEALDRTCKKLKWVFNRNKKTYRWFGEWVDDSPIPEFLFSPEQNAALLAMSKDERREYLSKVFGHCEHSISIPGCKYEIGLMRTWEGKLVAVWDWFYSGGLPYVLGTPDEPEKNPLMQTYTIECIKMNLEQQGVEYSEVWNEISKVHEIEVVTGGVWG